MKIYGEAGSSFMKDGKQYTFNAKGYLEIEEIKEEIKEEVKEIKEVESEHSIEEIIEEVKEIKPILKSKKK